MRTPFFKWLETNVPERAIVFRSQSQRALIEGLLMGVGIGFMPVFQAELNDELHQVIPPHPDWSVPFWVVTHVDIHRTPKVQAIKKVLLEVVQEAGLN